MPRFLPTAFVAPQVRKTVWTASALVAVSLLGGCSIWPKALTFGSGQDDATMAQASEPTLPMPGAPAMTAASASATAASAVAVAPAAEAPKVEPAAPAPVAPSNVPQPSPLPPPAPEVAAPAMPVAPAVAGKAASAPLVSGYYINVGLFAVASNANNAFQKLEKAGMPVFSDGVQSAKGPVTRVRVGPFASRAQATTAAAKIRSLKLEAVVFKQ